MATLKEYIELGEKLGLQGIELRRFAEEQRDRYREEKERERQEKEIERVEKEKEREFQIKLKEMDRERKQIEVEAEIKRKEFEAEIADKEFQIQQTKLLAGAKALSHHSTPKHSISKSSSNESDDDEDEDLPAGATLKYSSSLPKLPSFEENKDDMDAYLNRFERYAEQAKWPRDRWALYLSALLKGRALEVYSRLPSNEANDFDVLKLALLRRFEMTEEGFKRKFHNAQAEAGESPLQFGNRLQNYLERWLNLAKVDFTAKGIIDFWVREQYMATCGKELATFLRERTPTNLTELATFAEKYLDAHVVNKSKSAINQKPDDGNRNGSVNSGQSKGFRGSNQHNLKGQKVTDRNGKERRCYVCNKIGHLAKDCYHRIKAAGFQQSGNGRGGQQYKQTYRQSQNRNVSSTAISSNQSSRNNYQSNQNQEERSSTATSSASSVSAEGLTETAIVCRSHGRKRCCECGVGMAVGNACELLQRPAKTLECGCKIAYVHAGGSRRSLPTFEAWIGENRVEAMRDSGCSTVVVRRDLVNDDQLTGQSVSCVLIDGTCKDFPTAKIEIKSSVFNGTVVAVCMMNPMFDLIIGNLDGVKWNLTDRAGQCCSMVNEDYSKAEQLQAVVTRAQAKKENRKAEKPLKVFEAVDLKVTKEQLKMLQEKDLDLQRMIKTQGENSAEIGENRSQFVCKQGIWYRRKQFANERTVCQLVVPDELRRSVLAYGHDVALSGHLGRTKTMDRITAHFYWKGLTGDVNRYCQSCDLCQRTEPKGRTVKYPLGKMPVIDTPFKRVAIDLVGPIAPTTERGHRYILVMVDYATRYPEAVALKNIETETIAEALVNIYTRVGVPEEYLSDQGSQFMSGVMSSVSRLLSMSHLVSAPYHPICNGLVERFNSTLKSMLKKMCVERPRDWDRYLQPILFAYREVPQESLGFSSFELLYGRQVRGPLKILKELWAGKDTDEETTTVYQYVVDLKQRLMETCELAHQTLRQARMKQKTWYDRKARERKLKAGDQVLLLLPTDNNKLLMSWKGPFSVIRPVSECDYLIKLPNREKVFHINMLKKYHNRNESHTETESVHVETDSEIKSNCEITGAVIEVDDESECRIDWVNTVQTETYRDVHINPDLDSEIKEEMKQLLEEFHDVFSDVPGRTNLCEHRILLTSSEPVRTKAYPVPFAIREKIDRELDMMLKCDIIEPSEASFASPIVAVVKPDKSLRLCVDFRKLNQQTVFDPEPMITAEEIFAQLAGDRIFSKFDMSKGFWQIPIRQEDRDYTTMICHRGLFRFKTMAFGLVGSSASFTRMMRRLLQNLEKVHNYIDDVLAHTQNWSQHFQALRAFFTRVREGGLTLRPTKSYVGYQQISYLGFILSELGLRPNPEKIEKIVKAVRPVTKKQVRSLIGLASYYRSFVPNFADIVGVLTDLTKHGAPNTVRWTEECERSYLMLKSKLASSPILRLPDFSKTFTLQTDASDVGIGSVIVQEYEGVKHPIAFASKKLLPRERAWSVVERECYAIVWSIEKFSNYLYMKPFFLEVDHAPLQYLKSAKWQNSRVMRWAMTLQPYQFTVIAIPGKHNVCADFLSRNFDDEKEVND